MDGVDSSVAPSIKDVASMIFFMEPPERISELYLMVRDVPSGSGVPLARSERFELPTLGIEIRCSIQLSYERTRPLIGTAGSRCHAIWRQHF